jgi:hypothetical protein
VSWNLAGGARHVGQSTVRNNPGSPAGPAIVSFAQTNPASSPVTSNSGSVDFSVATNTTPATVAWSVDGSAQGSADGSGTSWTFSWPVSQLVDGAYQVGVQAFDQYGLPGAAKVLTVELNRNVALAPAGFSGGWNGSHVEFEWLPNAEGDIEGYRVYRQPLLGSPVLVCALTTDTTCRDSSPVQLPVLEYYVVAVDTDPAGDLREGDRSSKDVIQGNQVPYAPTALTATKDSYGNTILSWSEPSPPDPDNGGTIDFYRIYRDGTTYADRYDRTGFGELSFIDNNPGGAAHTYWVSAVDNHYAESTLVGPVTK